MKGVLFTQSLAMIDALYGTNMVDDILDECNLETDGAYTTVGTYPHKEFVDIFDCLSRKMNISTATLMKQYGAFFFNYVAKRMSQILGQYESVFDFLENVNQLLNVDLQNIYKNTHTPEFSTQRLDKRKFIIIYSDTYPLADLIHGMINGCANYFDEEIFIETKDFDKADSFGRIFSLEKL